MSHLKYDYTACEKLIDSLLTGEFEKNLENARQEIFNDVVLLESGQDIPAHKKPLDSGFINLPEKLLEEYHNQQANSLLGRILETAEMLKSELDRIVVLGIGGSYMGLRALQEALLDPYHNELSREARGGVPKLYYEGNNVDPDAIQSLLNLLGSQCVSADKLEDRWGIVVISKSGGTLETAANFRTFLSAFENYYKGDSKSKQYIVPVTGDVGKLKSLSDAKGFPTTFPIPEGVGGRFSIFTAVGLLPAAILGIDIVKLLEGAAEITKACKTQAFSDNVTLKYVAVSHLLEVHKGIHTRILSTWGKKLEATGLWYDQLLAESLGKEEKGAFPLTVVNTRDLHSRGQQHQEGVRDKLITNVIIESPTGTPPEIPEFAEEFNQDQLNKYAGKTYQDVMTAAIQGTNKAYKDVERPTVDLTLPELNEHTMGQLFQMFMLATAVEGRLIGINPYGQPGVEAYKTNMNAILSST